MEAKKFISTVKGFRTRFTNKPNVELEKKSIETVVEKMGGKLEVFTLLKESDSELLDYVKRVMGIVKVSPKKEESATGEDRKLISQSKDGKLYEIDTVKKTCKRVLKDMSELANVDINVDEMSMTTYQRYLADKFPGEGATIKKGKLYFRGYRVSCTIENGFLVEDSTKRYAVVETGFEGVPTPKELGEFFNRPRVEHTPEQLQEAVRRGKELAAKAKEEAAKNEVVEVEEIDFELLRKKVIGKVIAIRNKKVTDFDPELFSEMIPFKRWKRKVRALLKAWKERKIRYAKFLNELEKITREETFEEETEKKVTSKWQGTFLPEFTTVGYLKGDKLEVDGKLIDAVPFLLDYILYYVPKAMPQLMRYADGLVSNTTLLKNPFYEDASIEYNKRKFENTPVMAQLLSAFCASIDICTPQELLYEDESGLKVGDKILMEIDGDWTVRTITSVEKGVCIQKEIGLTKLDKWIKLD